MSKARPLDGSATFALVGDLDRDGRPDLVIGQRERGRVATFRGGR